MSDNKKLLVRTSTICIDDVGGFRYCDTLGDYLRTAQRLIEKYGEHTEYEQEDGYEGLISEYLTLRREETEEEMLQRLKTEEEEEERNKARRHERYLALKQEFEGEK